MAKICLIADTHFGTRKNSDIVLESQLRFFNNQMFPYLRENEIKNIIILGDVFDNRVAVNTKINNEVYKLFNNDFNYHILVGNHDCYNNSNTSINSLRMFHKFSNIHVIESIVELRLFDKKFLFVPWIFDEEQFLQDIKRYDSDICVGHFDVNTFSMGSKISESSLTLETFSKFKKVFSGHFHTPQKRSVDNMEFVYCGSPYQGDWGEVDQKKGFYILDTDTLEYEFIENTQSAKHIKVFYGDDIDPSIIKNNFIKVFIKESQTTEDKKIEEFTQKISDSGMATISTCIIKEELELDNSVLISESGQTLLELIMEFVSIQESIENKEKIKEIIEEIYVDSLRE